MRDWCARARRATRDEWRFTRIDQTDFDALEAAARTFGDLFARSLVRRLQRFRRKYVIEPMTGDEIREAIAEGRE